ncbi:MAG: phosphate ABC transporter permease PstA [Sedimentisphaerales bacterium]|nr:phosphate ABC transporter permease PstA [Sedimentisphaerales bacterium]
MSRNFSQKWIYWLMRLTTYFVVFVVGFIVLDIVWRGAGAINVEFLFSMPRRSGAEGGIWPAIVGTLLLVAGSIVLAFPFGVATAIYLSEYAEHGRFTRTIRIATSTLAGVPSIVFGLFGLGLFVIFLKLGCSIVSGCATLACMILPTIIVSSEEALRAVPQSLREGSLALGATKWQTIWSNVLPYSIGGMLTGLILAIGRVAGETAPILLTVAAFYLPRMPRSIFDQVMALPYHLYVLATQHPDTAAVRPKAYGTALVLLLLVLGMGLTAIITRIHFRKKYKW